MYTPINWHSFPGTSTRGVSENGAFVGIVGNWRITPANSSCPIYFLQTFGTNLSHLYSAKIIVTNLSHLYSEKIIVTNLSHLNSTKEIETVLAAFFFAFISFQFI
jgi:hypothetical protein